jgi:translation initiation factor 1 (eIF-1/SUI1)
MAWAAHLLTVIEIQGDQRPTLKIELEKRGFTVKIVYG